MEIKEIVVDIIIPLISGFLGGICGGTFINNKRIQKQSNKNSNAVQIGEINNGTK